MPGDVVRRLRRSARKEPQVWILLPLEHRLGERAVRLRQLDHPRAGGVSAAAGRERRLRLVDLDFPDAQDVEQLEGLERIALAAGITNAYGAVFRFTQSAWTL